MATVDYRKHATNALKQIQKFGRAIPITRETVTINPITGTNTRSEETWTINAITLPEEADMYKENQIRGETLKLICAATIKAPEPNDTMEFDDVTWIVVGIDTLSPSGTPIIHTLNAKRI